MVTVAVRVRCRLLRILEQPVISAHDLAQSRADVSTRRSRVLERVGVGVRVGVRVRVRVRVRQQFSPPA